ncbi:MAG: hypothetical protein RIR51_2114 [Bacteroidota bacterium]
MSFNIINKSISMPDGKEIQIETGKLAKQADGSVVVKSGNMMLLATVVAAQTHKEGTDFLPLSVDYQEKFASMGRIPGSFLKREARLSDYEILISRLVDRALRPSFPDDFHADTQVNINLISADADVSPDAFVGLAASAALAVSDIPFNGPISEVRVAKIDGEYVINPLISQMPNAELELIVAANENDILMVEGEANEVSEIEMLEAMKIAHEAIKIQIQALKELEIAAGKTEKREYCHEIHDEDLKKELWDTYYNQILEVVKQGNPSKKARRENINAIEDAYFESLPDDSEVNIALAKKYFHDIEKEASRQLVLNERSRLDGRKLNEIRPIFCEVNYLPAPHGSAVFTRGETQSLTTVTLGTKMDEQIIDQPMFQGYNKFMLHYNFPGFSTGEVKPNRGPGRREVGHGNLAMRAIKKVLPNLNDYPYTIRIVSDILESNGSSSMATVCAGTLALMDAGVKIKRPVSGIAMGLISDNKTGKYAVLSDILGDEDHLGDMDFKVTGSEKGITACQMDIKVQGLSYQVLEEALNQAKEGRLHILGKMQEAITESREEFKPQTPRAMLIKILKEQIGAVIGPGGKVIQDIQKQSGATITVEEKEDGGYVSIFTSNGDAMKIAETMIRGIVAIPEVGEVYKGKVKNIQSFGAFVEFLPGKDGLLHISEITWERLETVDSVLKEGDLIDVKLIEVDKKTGKFKLSAKVLKPRPEKKEEGQ